MIATTEFKILPMKNANPKTQSTAATNPVIKLAYTREELATQLGVCPMTITRLTNQGQLRLSRATRRPIYSHDEVLRFLRDTTSQPVRA